MLEAPIIVDAKGHLLGRLASVVAKEILSGQQIVVVRCEELNISGDHHRHKLKFKSYLRKRMNTNPSRGPYHHRSPSKIFFKAVRGMVPRRIPRGSAALSRLKVFEGVPPPYDRMKRMVVPQALRVVRLRPDRKYTHVGTLASQVGWKYADVIKRLEQKRKQRSKNFYLKKKEAKKVRKEAERGLDLSEWSALLEPVSMHLHHSTTS
ncbi:60S ribosomal protein L16 [Galdieria sulphuraria]|uniref:60S ribosomal protein L13A n=1 Tax=Galdieria sulphuraria TaxID=130081 RepID=M2Y898_GALSU|nr:60S ribosomal protein L13A [Galdieria sulphuraria]EME32064.1 60S ribosomal protein L13A [Galdieria sulphuraria]GJD06699.1 60S ribosomal protein L16 [Galdieria sulphuraria]|eukprot:XP_005708584.1 60S ribosomal protein L13A [Galdieria sulphuraria]